MCDGSIGGSCTPDAPGKQCSFLSSHGNLVPRPVAESFTYADCGEIGFARFLLPVSADIRVDRYLPLL
jgi:hypothetical protein